MTSAKESYKHSFLIQKARKVVEYANGLREAKAETVSRIKKNKAELNTISEVEGFLVKLQESIQEDTKQTVEQIVTTCLSAVCGPKYEFVMALEKKRNKACASLLVKLQDVILSPRDEDVGGGVIDVISFGLRMAAWVVTGKQGDVFVFDEPCKFLELAPEEGQRFAELVSTLSRRLDAQMIIVTHSKPLQAVADRMFYLSNETETKIIEQGDRDERPDST